MDSDENRLQGAGLKEWGFVEEFTAVLTLGSR